MVTLPAEVEVKNTIAVFNRLVGTIFDYDDRKKLSRNLRRQFDQHLKRWNDADDGWMNQVISAFSLWAVCGQGEAASLVRSQGTFLDPEELALVKTWRTEPCFFGGIHVVRKAKNGFVEAQTIDPPGRSLLLYSPALSALNLPSSTLVVTLFWKGPQAWHTYGPILDLPGLGASDLQFLLTCANPVPRKTLPLLKGVPTTGQNVSLNRNPVLAQLLFRYSGRPIVQTPHGPARMYLSAVRVNPEQAPYASGSWWNQQAQRKSESLGLIAMADGGTEVYLGQGSAMHDPWFTYDPNGTLFLGAMSAQAYQRGRAFLADLSIPEGAEVDVSIVTHSAVAELFPDLRDRYDEVSDLIKAQTDTPKRSIEQSEELAEAQRVMDRLVDNHNKGILQTTQELAEALGVDASVVQDYSASVSHLLNKVPQRRNVLDLPPVALSAFSRPGLPQVPGWFTLSEGPWSDRLLEDSPALRLFRWLVDQRHPDTDRIKATASGYLDPALVRKAWLEFWRSDPGALSLGRPTQERQWPWLLQNRRFFEAAGLLGQDTRGFFVNDRAKAILGKPQELFRLLLESLFTRQFFTTSPIADVLHAHFSRIGGLLLYSLGRFAVGSSTKWLTTRPLVRVMMEETGQERGVAGLLVDAVAIRGPFAFLGLVQVHKNDQGLWVDEPRFRPTALYRQVFCVDQDLGSTTRPAPLA